METSKPEELLILGRPVRTLDDARLGAALELKTEAAAAAIGAIKQALEIALDVVGVVEILRYEQARRRQDLTAEQTVVRLMERHDSLQATVLLRMVAANLRMPDKDGGRGLLSEEQIIAIEEWYVGQPAPEEKRI